MKICVYGGQYGSEGKGSASEWLCRKDKFGVRHGELNSDDDEIHKLIVAYDGGPNSGHTCSMGKTRNLPSAAFFADVVMLGPDSAINCDILARDIKSIEETGGYPSVYVHENAALVRDVDSDAERSMGLESRISSTCSGAGMARNTKVFDRLESAVVKCDKHYVWNRAERLDNDHWFNMINMFANHDWLFECSQGVMLDVNFGRYPYVTSRSTLPRVAIERNGFGQLDWRYFGVYRTFPIRTGGNSGPCYGTERKWEELKLEPEITTVTKRIRRVFDFSGPEFKLSQRLARGDATMFTHLDYINVKQEDLVSMKGWFDMHGIGGMGYVYGSDELGRFTYYGRLTVFLI